MFSISLLEFLISGHMHQYWLICFQVSLQPLCVAGVAGSCLMWTELPASGAAPSFGSELDNRPESPPAVSCSSIHSLYSLRNPPRCHFQRPSLTYCIYLCARMCVCMYICVYVLRTWYIPNRGHSLAFYHFKSASLCVTSPFFRCISFSVLHLAALSFCNHWVGVLPLLFFQWHIHQQTL